MYYGFVSSRDIGLQKPYIYSLFSPENSAFYIGQTYSCMGFLGRLSQHLSETPANTFIQKLVAIKHNPLTSNIEIGFCVYDASGLSAKFSKSELHREALEYLTQQFFIEQLCKSRSKIDVLSRVSKNDYTELVYIKKAAREVSVFFLEYYAKNYYL